jgi:hypothetical protein
MTEKRVPLLPIRTFKAWSWSRYKDHFRCPFYAKCRHLDKLAEPKGPALERGGRIDGEANDFITGKLKALPESLKLFKKEFSELVKRKATAQMKWAVDRTWKLVDFFDWDRAWGRMVLDAHWVGEVKKTMVAKVIDVKTGRVYEENEEQLELYAIPTLIAYPEVEVVQTELWYVDQGQIGGVRHFRREQLPMLTAGWEKRLVPMLTDTKFVPRPGDYCRRCHYRKSNDGPCKY